MSAPPPSIPPVRRQRIDLDKVSLHGQSSFDELGMHRFCLRHLALQRWQPFQLLGEVIALVVWPSRRRVGRVSLPWLVFDAKIVPRKVHAPSCLPAVQTTETHETLKVVVV